jgi:hypothetical protein
VSRATRIPAGCTFDVVERVGLTFPDVETATRYDGAKVLRVRGRFLAGVAMHPSAEPESLVVKVDPADRAGLLEDAPATYYLTDYYRPHPVVLVRLDRIGRDGLRDLLAMSLKYVSSKGRVSSPDDDYSPRNATSGSIRAARRAGR